MKKDYVTELLEDNKNIDPEVLKHSNNNILGKISILISIIAICISCCTLIYKVYNQYFSINLEEDNISYNNFIESDYINSNVSAINNKVVYDNIEYNNLDPDKEYQIVTTIINTNNTNQSTAIESESFTTNESNGKFKTKHQLSNDEYNIYDFEETQK